MRVAVVVAAMLFCAPVFAQDVKLPSVTNSIGMVLIEIPAGKFTMGSPEDEKGHEEDEAQVTVTLTKPFGLGKTEVTQGQWKAVMEKGFQGQKYDVKYKNFPALKITWDEATVFCWKLTATEHKNGKLPAGESYRLPTEAEWEYACRAGTTTAYSFGDDESKLDKYAWFSYNLLEMLIFPNAFKVRSKKPNPWGLHDMHGNVWEWCSDWYDGTLPGGADPVGPEEGSSRVIRGGSGWCIPGLCRSAYRGTVPSYRSFGLGFRVARSESATVTRPEMEKTEPVRKVFKGEIVTNSIGMELIEIPAGNFAMGSPKDEKFRHTDEAQVAVTLTKPFGLGKTEVTQGQWKRLMGTEPWDGQKYVKADKDCPATFVSYFDAVEFCEKLTELERESGTLKAGEEYRLPTEAEWEYACRAGTETAFSFGDGSKLNAHAWWGGFDFGTSSTGEDKAGGGNAAREQYAHKVDMKKPNPWGLHDMHGNVGEWCSDWYGNALLSGGVDPVGPNGGSNRVNRGGGWQIAPGGCRSADRGNCVPSIRYYGLGFRVARSQSAQ